jgi:hypothetical protein
MNERDVVRVKETVLATFNFEDTPSKLRRAGGEQLSPHTDKPPTCIEFNERYRGKPFLVDLEASNLEWFGNQDEQNHLR